MLMQTPTKDKSHYVDVDTYNKSAGLFESKFLMMGDKSFWDLKSNRRALMDLIAQQLNIHQVKYFPFGFLFEFSLFILFISCCFFPDS